MASAYKHKKLFNYKYPKLTLLLIIIILSYLFFSNLIVENFFSHLGSLSYIGIFIGGLLFSFGFTTPIAIGIFLVSSPNNILIAALIGGFGAMIADLTIFAFIKITLMDEFRLLEKTKVMKETEYLFKNTIHGRIKHYLLFIFAGIVIASPLPDELGVGILAGMTHIKYWEIAVLGLIFNSLGILIMLLI